MGELQLNDDGTATYFFDEPDVIRFAIPGLPIAVPPQEGGINRNTDILVLTANMVSLLARIEALERAADRSGDDT